MRTPYRLRQRPAVSVRRGLIQSIRFIPCVRCMGHGHFETDPPERVPVVAFSQTGALQYLAELLQRKRLHRNQAAALELQILRSGLPDEIPAGVEAVVDECLSWEEKVVALATRGSVHVAAGSLLEGSDLTDLVHAYLLEQYANLRSH